MGDIPKKQVALLLLIYFSKAFDMVDHEILLYHYGIEGEQFISGSNLT